MNIFPGTRVFEKFDDLREELILQINPQKLLPIDNIKNWKRLDNEIYSIGKLEKHNEFYLLYTHPVHNYLDKLFVTNYDELLEFLKGRIVPEKEEGLDLIIASKDFRSIIVCNHDGKIYLVK